MFWLYFVNNFNRFRQYFYAQWFLVRPITIGNVSSVAYASADLRAIYDKKIARFLMTR